MNSMRYVYHAQVIFVEKAPGIYHVAKTRAFSSYKKDTYYSANEIVPALNKFKVALCKDDINRVIHVNFQLTEQKKED